MKHSRHSTSIADRSVALDRVRFEVLKLQIQLQPHFLFNTLNLISCMIKDEPARAQRMLARLSDLFRYMIDRTGKEEVTLREELASLDMYFDLVRERFGNRLRVKYDVSADLNDIKVPAMIIIPIVENSVKHGVMGSTGPVTIRIAARRRHDHLLLQVFDDGGGVSAIERGHSDGTGVGIAKVQDLLHMLYGEGHKFQARTVDHGFEVTMEIPMGSAQVASTEPI